MNGIRIIICLVSNVKKNNHICAITGVSVCVCVRACYQTNEAAFHKSQFKFYLCENNTLSVTSYLKCAFFLPFFFVKLICTQFFSMTINAFNSLRTVFAIFFFFFVKLGYFKFHVINISLSRYLICSWICMSLIFENRSFGLARVK